MDNQRNLLLNWTYFHQEKSMDELRQTLLLTMELEDTRMKAQEELKMRDEQISQLKELLSRAIKERDEAQEHCQKVLFEKLLLQQQLQHSGVSSVEDDHKRGMDGFSSSDCDESIVSSPHHLPPPLAEAEPEMPIVVDRPLPEKGKLLQAVMKAGPLLQTLLLAGPLPQWRHPPPPLDSYQIPPPPVAVPPPVSAQSFHSNICGRNLNRKRGLCEGSESSTELKYQRMVLQ
ncbi:UNVERIFIED_CONTAM: hypothetical protein Scaly_0414500 [Sesamum calycinum]|uniref:Uncharacterized protein n=1 Tax=Sesamum calycinum TaxID=2727403 RepID=A0AAW2SEK7_9LAMI